MLKSFDENGIDRVEIGFLFDLMFPGYGSDARDKMCGNKMNKRSKRNKCWWTAEMTNANGKKNIKPFVGIVLRRIGRYLKARMTMRQNRLICNDREGKKARWA